MKSKPTTTKNSTVYISNLSYKKDRTGLKMIFSKFGPIKHIKIVVEPKTNQSRGMAFVEMGSSADAKKAIEALNGQIIDGRTVKANWAIPLKDGDESKVIERDLEYTAIQLAKKARNDARRKSNPLQFIVKKKAP
ncbi:MAG: RNA recognition motif domain-containing protein [Bacteriovoracaceae bacterium]